MRNRSKQVNWQLGEDTCEKAKGWRVLQLGLLPPRTTLFSGKFGCGVDHKAEPRRKSSTKIEEAGLGWTRLERRQ
jgi:hypothetical protein